MLSASMGKRSQFSLYIRHLTPFQQRLQIDRTQFVLFRRFNAAFPHAYQRNLFRCLLQDILCDGLCVHKTAGQDFFRTRGVDDALGAGAGGMNDPFSPDLFRLNGGRGVSQVAAFDLFSLPFSDKDTVWIFLPPGEGILNAANRADLFSPEGIQPTLHGKSPKYINNHSQAFCLPCAVNQMINLYLHQLYSRPHPGHFPSGF